MSERGRRGSKPRVELSISREEFERIWSRDSSAALTEQERELIKRYERIIAEQPICEVQLWRLEKLERQAQEWTSKSSSGTRPGEADIEQRFHVDLLSRTLKYIHHCRWRRMLTPEQCDAVLAPALEILGEAVAAPAYAAHLPEARGKPTAYTALLATIGILDGLRTISPQAAERFIRRNSPLAGI